MHIQAKTNDRRVRRFGDILAPLSRETKLNIGTQGVQELFFCEQKGSGGSEWCLSVDS